MRPVIFCTILLISSQALVADPYQWCQAMVDQARDFTTYPLSELIEKKRAYARASSLEEFEVLTGKEYSKMVPLAQKNQGITKEEAENRILAVFKQIEIRNLNLAIKLHGMSDDQTWNMAFDECVKAQE